MSVVSVKARSFILALFIRDDGERFLLGDNGYDFKDSQLHFAANTIENDEVMKQGADGVMVAGQVRRASVQSFDGFVGDATMAKETIEQMRRDFFAFFIKGHHFRVVYVDCNRNAWQRKGGYLVDAPEVKELWQIHPEYHVGLNFEDVNYYSYDEDSEGEEILSNLVDVPVSTAASGGLVWDEDGAVSEDAEVEYDSEATKASGKSISISDAAEAPLASFQLDGETSQNGTPTPSAPVAVNTTTGENVVQICGKNLLEYESRFIPYSNYGLTTTMDAATGIITINGTFTGTSAKDIPLIDNSVSINIFQNYSYYIGIKYISGSKTGDPNFTARTVLSSGSYYWNNAVPLVHENRSVLCNINNAVRFDTIRFFVPVGATFDNYKVLPYINANETGYEPYQGQSYEVNLGKNLFDKDLPLSKTHYTNTGATATYTKDQFINFTLTPTSRSLIMSYSARHDQQQGSAIAANVRILQYNSSGAFISRLMSRDNNHVFSLDSNTTRILVCIDAGEDAYFDNLQLEYGSSATSYAAYFEPIELCKIGDYQDYIYKSDGKWYVHKEVGKVVLDGVNKSFSDRYTTTGSHYRFVYTDQSIPNYAAGTVAQIYCDILIGGTIVDTYRRVECVAYNDASNRLIMYISSIEDYTLAAANTWLESNSITVYYILATPTDTEITNEALVGQLEAVLGGRTYAGINNIFTITSNEQGTLEVGYYTKYHLIVVGGGYVWEAGGAGGATIVVNNSIDNVNPIWKIYGPTMNPQLENSTTGEVIEYVGLIAEGQTLTIDIGEQTASLDGLNVISNLVGDFISLAPGANRLIYSVSGDAGASEIGWSEIVG